MLRASPTAADTVPAFQVTRQSVGLVCSPAFVCCSMLQCVAVRCTLCCNVASLSVGLVCRSLFQVLSLSTGLFCRSLFVSTGLFRMSLFTSTGLQVSFYFYGSLLQVSFAVHNLLTHRELTDGFPQVSFAGLFLFLQVSFAGLF